jgi:L-galactose dehydrogenase
MEYTTFGSTGLRVSKLGLGGAPIGGDFHTTEESEVQRVVHEALDLGINFIDTAPVYGNGVSERRIGQALAGGRREKVVLASKAARSSQVYHYQTILQSVEESLERLQTDWIDLLQLHDVETQSYDVVMNEAVPALEKLKQEGKIRLIGVSSRNMSLLMKYMRTGKFDAIQSYVRYMLLDHSLKEVVLPLAEELGIGVINGSVLGMGILADSPARFLLKQEDQLARASAMMEQLSFLRKSEPNGLIEPAMRFSLANPDIHVTLTGSASLRSIRANAGYCDGRGLSEEELKRIYSMFNGDHLFPDV